MRIAVVGAGGVLGRAICLALAARGDSVAGFTKNLPASNIPLSNQIITGERDALTHVATMGPWDCVIDLRAFNTHDLATVEEAFRTARHWIYLSTMYVYRLFSPFSLENTPNNQRLAEDVVCAPHGIYGAGKYACEQLLCKLAGNRVRLSILRLPFVIGDGDRSSRVSQYIQKIESNDPITLPAAGRHKVELIFADDVAERIVELLDLETPSPLVSNITGGPCLSLAEHLAIVARILHQPIQIKEWQISPAAVRQPYAFPFDIELCRRRFNSIFGSRQDGSDWEHAWKTAILSEKRKAQTNLHLQFKESYE